MEKREWEQATGAIVVKAVGIAAAVFFLTILIFPRISAWILILLFVVTLFIGIQRPLMKLEKERAKAKIRILDMDEPWVCKGCGASNPGNSYQCDYCDQTRHRYPLSGELK
jgi:ribosomal protein L40E